MPFNVHVIRTADFIRVNSKGELDVAESKRVLSQLAKVCVDNGIKCALLDVRNSRGDLQIPDLYELARAFREMGFQKDHRLAILHRASGGHRVEFFALRPGDRARFFAMIASDQGWNVEAFDDFEKAMEWFHAESPDE